VVDDPSDATRVMDLLGDGTCGECHVGDDGRTVRVPVPEVTGMVPDVVRKLDAAAIAIRDVTGRRSTLDDVFFALTGHAAEEESPDGETEGPPAEVVQRNGGNGDSGVEERASSLAGIGEEG
jgi:hypothetical protein